MSDCETPTDWRTEMAMILAKRGASAAIRRARALARGDGGGGGDGGAIGPLGAPDVEMVVNAGGGGGGDGGEDRAGGG